MNRTNSSTANGRAVGQRGQRGFFDAGLGLALFAMFSLVSAAFVTQETGETDTQVASCTSAASEADCIRK